MIPRFGFRNIIILPPIEPFIHINHLTAFIPDQLVIDIWVVSVFFTFFCPIPSFIFLYICILKKNTVPSLPPE